MTHGRCIYTISKGEVTAHPLAFDEDPHEVVAKAKKADPEAERLKVVEIIISRSNPLSNQCLMITGCSYNYTDWEDFSELRLIRHKKTGIYLQVYNLEYLKSICI